MCRFRVVAEQYKVLVHYYGFRIPGNLPENLEGDPWVSFNISQKSIEELGEKFTLIITLRFTDQFGLQRWEQGVTTTYEAGTGEGLFGGPFWSTPRGHEIRLNRQHKERREHFLYPWERRRLSI